MLSASRRSRETFWLPSLAIAITAAGLAICERPIDAAQLGAAQRRIAVPSAAAQKKSEDEIQEIFQADIAKAKKPAEKLELSEKFLQQGIETQDEPAASYVLLRNARDLAAAAGSAEATLAAVSALCERFEVELSEAQQLALTEAAKHSPTDLISRQAFVEKTLAAMNEAIESNHSESAARLGAIATSMAAKSKDLDLKKRVQVLVGGLKRQTGQLASIEAMKKTLANKPDDTDLNLKLGKQLCLARGEWEEGLPYLAKGGDAKLAPLAQLELANPQSGADQAKLADGWHDLAANDKVNRRALQARARHWYEISLASLEGLAKVRVEKRLAGLVDAEPVEKKPEKPAKAVASKKGKAAPRSTKSNANGGSRNTAIDRQMAEVFSKHSIQYRLTFEDGTRAELQQGPVPAREFIITMLNFHGAHTLTDSEWSNISKMPNLRCIVGNQQGYSPKIIKAAIQVKALTELAFDYSAIQDDDLNGIGALVGLEKLGLAHAKLSDAGITKLAPLKNLKELSLQENPATGSGLKALRNFNNLTALRIGSQTWTSDVFADAAMFPRLEDLYVINTTLDSKSSRPSKPFAAMKDLALVFCRIDNADLKYIADRMPQLRHLTLNSSTLSDTSLQPLTRLRQLEILEISVAGISDVGLANVATLKQLRYLYLNRDISDAAIAKLRQALPECNIRKPN